MNKDDVLKDLNHIRILMEKSTKFISISGLSGVLIGIYALVAVSYAYLFRNVSVLSQRDGDGLFSGGVESLKLMGLAVLLLAISLLTGIILARKNAKENQQNIWNSSSKAMFSAVGVPLFAGGAFAFAAAVYGVYFIIIPSFLVFYGIALFSGSIFTFKEIRYIGLMEIALGLLALIFVENGLIFFALGFGILHIIYGLIIKQKYGA